MKNKNKVLCSNILQQNPEAWVAISNNRQKIYGSDDDVVYLEDGQEFQIELFNPTQISYLAKIYLNGNLISESGLVIKPGQRYFLDRHIDENKKLLFSTYDVDSSEEVKKAIENNGNIKVEFYPEVFMNHFSLPFPKYVPHNSWNGTYIGNLVNLVTSGSSGSVIRKTNLGDSTKATNISYYSSTNSISSNLSDFKYSTTNNLVNPDLIETGRIEKGEKSEQSFGRDNGTYSTIWAYSSEYKILPKSAKPMEVSEIRSYCTKCGTRMKKKSWKFCPNCGQSIV